MVDKVCREVVVLDVVVTAAVVDVVNSAVVVVTVLVVVATVVVGVVVVNPSRIVCKGESVGVKRNVLATPLTPTCLAKRRNIE